MANAELTDTRVQGHPETTGPEGPEVMRVTGSSNGVEHDEALLLTVKEAARLMRIGRDMAYALVAEGRIPAIRLGRHIRIPRASLIAHLQREAEQGSGEKS
jgi:excisionase family DNA binding protein